MRSAPILVVLLLGCLGCRARPDARYEPTHMAPSSPRAAPSVRGDASRFPSFSDEAADRYLTEQVAAAIEAEVRERDAARRRAEVERQPVQRVVVRGPAYRYGRRRAGSHVPWNTLVYGGLGAVIGHQYGHRDRGFAIGASLGLLQDLMRWRY